MAFSGIVAVGGIAGTFGHATQRSSQGSPQATRKAGAAD
jgi:hypothetical protein